MGSARLGNQVPHVLHLYFHEADVGAVTNLVLHQGTWFGTLERRIAAVEDPTIDMFISFCQRWHDRLDAGGAPDAIEFEAFPKLLRDGSWTLRSAEGQIAQVVAQAPVFLSSGEITWSPLEPSPA